MQRKTVKTTLPSIVSIYLFVLHLKRTLFKVEWSLNQLKPCYRSGELAVWLYMKNFTCEPAFLYRNKKKVVPVFF